MPQRREGTVRERVPCLASPAFVTAPPRQGSSKCPLPDDWEADVEDGDLQPVVYSKYMSPEEIADLLISTSPDRVDTSVYSDFYTFLL